MTGRVPFGQATTAPERAVEAVLSQAGLGNSASVSFQRMNAGITNLNWLVFDGDRVLFLKLYGEHTGSFINRAAGSAASRTAGELGVGPRLLACFDDPGAELYEFLDGYRNVSSEDMLSPAVRRALLAGYRRMHAAPLIGQTRTGFDQLHQRARLAREGGAPLAPDLDALLAQCARAEAAIQAAGPSLAVCHNDSYAANFMINDAGEVRIIDWEYAANNDPCWDLAMIAMSQNASAIADMVTDYLGEPCARTTARLRAYAPVVFISWGLWAALQSRVSTIPFDFRKYSKTLTQLGRAKLRDPAWEAALWAL